jgi:phospholipase D1/2
LLQPGRNCWRLEQAHRFGMLVDAQAYFNAVREAIRDAYHSVFILSWDIDSRVPLVPGGADDGYPEPLGEFLKAVADERPDLHIYVLNWDFAMLYGLEREWLPVYKNGWEGHDRIHFHMDGKHPMWSSHHQKIVVVDDAVAFVGGLDLTSCRWDTPEHQNDHPLRVDLSGKPYGPFHDVQAVVDGEAARALGELVRERWRTATGEAPLPLCSGPADRWPQSVWPDITDVLVGIARTEPAYAGNAGVDEIRQLHLDAISSARRTLFFENQYFTSGLIADALAARLQEEQGPEVVIITPENQSGWLEEATMGLLRARLHRRLKAADRYDRYRLYCPSIEALGNACLNVHSKVFTVDEELFTIGSANLSNRSMATDTECNLVIEAIGDDAERLRQAIANMRNRLLAEHLASVPEAVDVALHERASLHEVIRLLHRPSRHLREFNPVAMPEVDSLIPENALFDPEKPIEPDELVAQLVPKDAHKPLPRRLIGLGTFAIALAALALLWRWTPLSEWVNLASMVELVRQLEALPFTPIAVIGGYVLAGLVMLPIMLLIAVTGIVFGPVEGFFYALAGTLLSGATTYGLGRWLGRDVVRRLVGPRINRLSRHIAKQGILAMVIIRMLPVAPYTVVNMIAGASHIRFRDYLLGTLIGMLPGIALTVTFVHNLAQAIRNPSPGTIAVLAVVAVLLVGAAMGLQRVLGNKAKLGA